MTSFPLDYTWVGWKRRRGDWVKSEGYFQLLILHLCVYQLSQFTSADLLAVDDVSISCQSYFRDTDTQ
jgi:hypothetical protein